MSRQRAVRQAPAPAPAVAEQAPPLAARPSPHDQWVVLQRGIGNQALLRLMGRNAGASGPHSDPEAVHAVPEGGEPAAAPPLTLRPQLAVGAVDDPLERDADRAAAEVMGMGEPKLSPSVAAPAVQRKCATCAEEDDALRRSPSGPGVRLPGGGAAPPIVHAVLRSPGRPLDAASRNFFEPRFGRDFSRVRVHADAAAGVSARAVGANAYTVGSRIVFAAGRETASDAGRRLLAHELAHVVQQERGRAGVAPVVRRQAAPATPTSDVLHLGGSEDVSDKNPRIAAFATAAQQALGAAPKAIIKVDAFWNSKSTFVPGAAQTQDQLRGVAQRRADAARSALVRLGVPAASLSAGTSDFNAEGAPKGTEGEVLLVILRTPFVLPQPLPIGPLGPVQPSPRPTIVIEKDADLSTANTRLVERLKSELMPWLREGAQQRELGSVQVVIYVGQDEIDPTVTQRNRAAANARDATLRQTLQSIGTAPGDVTTDVKVVPTANPMAGKVTITPKAPAAKPEEGFDLEKLTTIQIQTSFCTFVIKVPKSLELKFRPIEGKVSIPTGLALKWLPVRGVPGVEIGLSGEITKLSDLFSKPPQPPPLPGAPPLAAPGPPLKFSLSAALNGKGYKIEASAEVNLSTRAFTAGLYYTLIEAGHTYQIPSSVWDDLNKAGAQLQKAVNALMNVPNPPPGIQPVGLPVPDTPASTDPLSNVADVIDAMSKILDNMDKIDKAKTQPATPKLKIGPQIVQPIGPPTGPANLPSIGFGITGTF